MIWVGHVVHMGKINAYKLSVENPEGKRLLGRHMLRGGDNIRIYLWKIGCGVGLDLSGPG